MEIIHLVVLRWAFLSKNLNDKIVPLKTTNWFLGPFSMGQKSLKLFVNLRD
jgi:hypothetical protein